jgi:hypothetical protein
VNCREALDDVARSGAHVRLGTQVGHDDVGLDARIG